MRDECDPKYCVLCSYLVNVYIRDKGNGALQTLMSRANVYQQRFQLSLLLNPFENCLSNFG